MSLVIQPLHLGTITLDASGLVLFRRPGTKVTIPSQAFLITGGSEPVLVDTGYRHPDDFLQLGMGASRPAEHTLEAQLALHGYKLSDIRQVVQTHAHLDHAGGTDLFPMSTVVSLARRELEFSVSGAMAGSYLPEQAHHFIDRLYTKGALRLFDVDGTYEEEVIPGVAVGLSGGHTPGSISVLVETDAGTVNICGDIFYDNQDNLFTPIMDIHVGEPTVTANRAMTLVDEKRAIKKAFSKARYLLPGHDTPILVESGIPIRHLPDGVPGSIAPVSIPVPEVAA